MTSEQKSVKVYARITPPTGGAEELMVVGHSHPGEIRRLRENGLAEWVGGKVILNIAPSPKGEREGVWPDEAIDAMAKFNEDEDERILSEILAWQDADTPAVDGNPQLALPFGRPLRDEG